MGRSIYKTDFDRLVYRLSHNSYILMDLNNNIRKRCDYYERNDNKHLIHMIFMMNEIIVITFLFRCTCTLFVMYFSSKDAHELYMLLISLGTRRSRERSTCLAWRVSVCISRQKRFQVSFASPWLQWRNVLIPLRLNLLNTCVYLNHRRSILICLLCTKVVSNNDFRRKLTTSGGRKKTKTCFNLKSILGKEISSDCFLTNISCCNCADKNETLVRKLHGVRESLKSSRKAITEEKGGITSVKRQARDSDCGTGEQKSNKTALFVVHDDPPFTDSSIAVLLCRDGRCWQAKHDR